MSEANVASAKPLSQLMRMAVMAGVESAVQIHIDRGDDLNARDANGMTPLMLAAARDKPAICKLLLSAGAEHGVVDHSGRTALDIAIEAGSHATAAVLTAVRAPLPTSPQKETVAAPELGAASEACLAPNSIVAAGGPTAHDSHAAPTEPGAPSGLYIPEPTPPSTAIADAIADQEFDLSGWEAEEEPTRPEADFTVVKSASAVQIAITAHQPMDSSAEWDDIEAYLPEVALPLARADDAEARASLRVLLLRALREGSVPALDVQAKSSNEDRSNNSEAEAYLTMVINDLGAEVDERSEYSTSTENFEVFVDPYETPDEESSIDEALGAIDRATSPRHDPLRIYQREFQRLRLLTAEEEIQLAKDMEAALDAALDAMANWPSGIARTLAAGADALTGARQLSSIWIGGESDTGPASAEILEAGPSAAEGPEGTADDDAELGNEAPSEVGDSRFADALHHLAALAEAQEASRASPQEIRKALSGLRLNRRFLLELMDTAHGSAPCPTFALAMTDLRKHRDRMAAANLKLAFFHAKKYLYCGEPLDDLAQEGNIGLLKAVDRYDWRRGFRFSTYATWWVRQQISRYVADKSRTVRVPVHIFEKIQRAKRVTQTFETALGREPTLVELSERTDMSPHKLAALLRITPEPSGIDDLVVDGMISIDAKDDYVSPDPADIVMKRQLNRAVDRLISGLSSKDRKEEQILRMRFGIGVDDVLTLDEIGARFEVTRERIRQIEAKAIRKLQHPSRSESFGRLVLGLYPEQIPLAHCALSPSEEGETDTNDATPQPARPTGKAAAQHPPQHSEGTDASRPPALDKLLMKAVELGIRVDDDRPGSGRIWVGLMAAGDHTHRRFARKLLEFGFAFWPGKGYWI